MPRQGIQYPSQLMMLIVQESPLGVGIITSELFSCAKEKRNEASCLYFSAFLIFYLNMRHVSSPPPQTPNK
jgi:hypothetical protein